MTPNSDYALRRRALGALPCKAVETQVQEGRVMCGCRTSVSRSECRLRAASWRTAVALLRSYHVTLADLAREVQPVIRSGLDSAPRGYR
jgi:hypothetical protein